MTVRVPRGWREVGTAEPAPSVPKGERRAVWTRWLEEGRYRSVRELAEAVGLSAAQVSRVLRGLR
jgi:16S rRNA U516 pseudouridylate synthase RsuA-like enzyme